jgi:hypothetical protein
VQLASCYAANKLWTEALDLYSTLVKNSKGLPLQTSRCGLRWSPLLKQAADGTVTARCILHSLHAWAVLQAQQML